jgi:hypothetical protein
MRPRFVEREYGEAYSPLRNRMHKIRRVVFDTLALRFEKHHRPACFAMNSTIGVLSSNPCG